MHNTPSLICCCALMVICLLRKKVTCDCTQTAASVRSTFVWMWTDRLNVNKLDIKNTV